MKKSLALIAIASVLCLALTGCGSSTPKLIENMDNKLTMESYNISGDLKINDDTYTFKGMHAKDITDVHLSKNDIADYSNAIIDSNNVYLKNKEVLNDLEGIFNELDDTDAEYILIPGGNEKVNLENLDFNIINKYFNIALKNTLSSYVSQDKKLVSYKDKVYTFTLNGESATKFVNDTINILINNVDTIYDEIINNASENMQSKLKTSREKNTQKLTNLFTSAKERLTLGEGASFIYKNQIMEKTYSEAIHLSDNNKSISLTLNMSPNNEALVNIPEDFVNISQLKPISEEAQRLQLDEFYAIKYPEAAEMKSKLIEMGYDEPKYSTSLEGISLYGTRASKSIGFDYGVVDEVVVDFIDGWVSEVTMISCFSKKDSDMYGISALNTYIEEMEQLIEDDFLIEIGNGVGFYENVMEKWEFYVNISEVEINNNGLLTVELVAKQH